MRRCKHGIVLGVAAAMLLATAASAYAGASSSGTVYGQATMQPTVALVIGGCGRQVDPLSYSGTSGSTDYRYNANNWATIVSNDGDANIYPMLEFGSNPTLDGDSSKYWTYGSGSSDSVCTWSIGQAEVPAQGGNPVPLATTSNSIASGRYKEYGSWFTFPTSYAGGTFYMTALITAGDI